MTLRDGDLAVFHSDTSSGGVRITSATSRGAPLYEYVHLPSEMPGAAPRGLDRIDPWDGTAEQLRALRRAWLAKNPKRTRPR